MKKSVLVLLATLLGIPAAHAQEITGKVYFGRGGMDRIIDCHPSVYKGPGGKLYYRRVDCPGDGMKYSDIGVPLYGPVIKMPVREATHFRRLSNEMIQLY